MREWWKRRTFRFRLGVWYAGTGTLLLGLFSATIYLFVAQRMARPLAFQLLRDVDEVQRRLVVGPDRTLVWDGVVIRAGSLRDWNGPWFELWDERDQLIRRVWPFEENQLNQGSAAPVRDRETISIYSVSPELRLRTLGGPFPVAGGQPDWMMRVMRVHEPNADALGALLAIIAVSLPVVVATLAVGGYFLTRRWLRPLDEMVAASNQITAEDLGRRLPVPNPHDELGRLGTVFNVTLQRLEDSFSALERFVADASHELRTPLTTLRSVGEVGLRKGRTVEEYREIIASMLEEAQRLQALTSRLLELAQAEGGARLPQLQRLRVDEFVAAAVTDIAVLAEAKEQQLRVQTVPCSLDTDPVLLRQAMLNLVENAVKYSPAGSLILVTVARTDRSCLIAVTDAGPGVSAADEPRLTARFFRAGGDRGRDGSGFGLGLALTRAYLKVLGAELEYESVLPHGSRFRIVLPLPGPTPRNH